MGESFTVFAPGELRNYANRGWHGGHQEASYRKRWREKVHLLALTQPVWRGPELAKVPKVVTLEAQVWNLFDAHDGLRNALKACVDGLVAAGVLHSDGPGSGHSFIYAQQIDRARRGVRITVETR